MSPAEREAPPVDESMSKLQEQDRRRMRVWSVGETEQQMGAIRELLLRGVSYRQILIYCRNTFGVGIARGTRLIRRANEQFSATSAGMAPFNKALAEARLLSYIAQLQVQAQGERHRPEDRKKLGEWKVPPRPNWNALARHEELLSRIQGTAQPIKVDVTLTANAALHAVLYDRTEEQVSELLEEALENKRLAEMYKMLPPAGGMKKADGEPSDS